MKTLKPHPYAELVPLMRGKEFEEFVEDIFAFGQRAPITLLDGKILDGRNRYRACQALGIEPKTREYTGKDPLAFILSVNIHRRQLTAMERAQAVLKIAKLLKKAPNGALSEVTEERAAKLAGVSRRTVQRAKAKAPKKKSKPREPGWTKEELAKDQQLSDHFDLIEAVYGAADTKAIKQGTVNMTRADVLFLARLPKERMLAIQDLIFANRWAPKKAIAFINTDPDDDSTVEDLKNLCLSTKGKYWTLTFGGFQITVRGLAAAKR